MNDNKLMNRAADNIRILAASMVEKANSGHPGGAMGGADFVNVLFSEFLVYDPENPACEGRDRFFLDPGHMSPMLYSTLALTGKFTLDELKEFRQWGSHNVLSMIVVEDMELKDVAALKEKIEAVDHVKKVLWYDSVLDVSVPVEMLPKDLREAFFNGDATMMIALFDNTTSSETSMEAVTQIRKITSKNCFVSGMTGIVTDIKQIALKEMPIYVVIASCLSLIVLLLAMDSLVVPVLFLLCITVQQENGIIHGNTKLQDCCQCLSDV